MLDEFRTPRLTTFIYRDEYLLKDDKLLCWQRLNAIIPFIARFSTLKTLVLDVEGLRLKHPAIEALAKALLNHKQSLRSLMIYHTQSRRKYYTEVHPSIISAIAECTELEELVLWIELSNSVSVCEVNTIRPRPD